MAIDFGGLATTDLYQTQFVPKINEVAKAVACLLDPATISYTGTPYTGAYRLNNGNLERFNGTSWVAQSINGFSAGTGNPTVSSTNPVFVLKDTDNSGTGVGQTGYISFQDSSNTERAWMGYGSPSSTDLNIYNSRGNVTIQGNLALTTANVGTYALSTGGGTVAANADQIITINRATNAAGWNYIGFSKLGTRKAYIGINDVDQIIVGSDTNSQVQFFSTGGASFSGPLVGSSSIKVNRIAVGGNNPDDLSSGSPSYGLGWTTTDLFTAGGYQVQLSGWNGVRVRSNNALFDVKPGGFAFNSSGGINFMGTDSIANFYSSTGTQVGAIQSPSSTGFQIAAVGSAALTFAAGGATAMTISASRVITDKDGLELGYKGIPAISTTGGTAGVAARGQCYHTTGGITVPASTFSAGDAFSIYNNSSASITVTQGASLTLRQVGTANTGNRTLAQRGFCTVYFVSATEAVISGAGVS